MALDAPRLGHRLRCIHRGVRKSWPDFRTLIGGTAPSFVYGARHVRELPVFVYHRVDASLENDLERLAAAGFRTIGADEIEAHCTAGTNPDPRAIVLTFDDGDESLVETAVPLLERHGFRALAFVVPGLVPERRAGGLAGWRELRDGVRRGILEVGPHSLYHHQVPVSGRVLGFVEPLTDTAFTANLPTPRARGDEPAPPGTPIFPGAPRYALRAGFLPDPEVKERCVALAREEGADLFQGKEGLRHLRAVAGRVRGRREGATEMKEAIVRDVAESVRIVAEQCPNPGQAHFCYPWFVGSPTIDRWAGEVGVRVVHKGIVGRHRPAVGPVPATVRRLPPDFIGRLPGPDRRPLRALAARRLPAVRHRLQ